MSHLRDRNGVQRQHRERQQEKGDKAMHPGLGQPLLSDWDPLHPQGLLAHLSGERELATAHIWNLQRAGAGF